MLKSKVRIWRLTLAPSALGHQRLDEVEDAEDEVANCIRDLERLHRAV
jgi:hypothetical protein